jgi:hypothetical protein
MGCEITKVGVKRPKAYKSVVIKLDVEKWKDFSAEDGKVT